MEKYLAIFFIYFVTQAYGQTIQNEEWPFCEPGGHYTLPHSVYCDRFFSCQRGIAYMSQCADGLGFVPNQGCALLHLVNCTNRPKLQPPKGQGNCPRLNGLFPDKNGCGQYYRCENGTAVPVSCAPMQVFEDSLKICREMTDAEKTKCNPPVVSPPVPQENTGSVPQPSVPLGNGQGEVGSQTPEEIASFKCPKPGVYPFGDHGRYAYPKNCHYYIMCLQSGGIKVGGCPEGTGYDPLEMTCDLKLINNDCNRWTK